jgi:hypothetical protein
MIQKGLFLSIEIFHIVRNEHFIYFVYVYTMSLSFILCQISKTRVQIIFHIIISKILLKFASSTFYLISKLYSLFGRISDTDFKNIKGEIIGKEFEVLSDNVPSALYILIV